ncbi:MAG: 2-hydroxychromene-2-carboxylate isomerase [Burkholderiaceae bacterium]|nr:2-hydroxychromene-2-carboxylate isomerase [Burkholderiaceae bacterium]
MKTIDYYFAPSSPWTYLGHQRLAAIAAKHEAAIRVMPVDIAGRVFPTSGGLPLPQRAPQRQAYRLVELRRWSNHLGIALNLQPRYFPPKGHDAARLIILADLEAGSDAAMALAFAVMQALWAEDKDTADSAVLAALADRCGLPGARLVDELASADARYAQYTEQAVEAQVFGAPWYTYRGEPFWGQDRLEFLDRALAAPA